MNHQMCTIIFKVGNFFRVVGNRGAIEMNARDMMAKESSIIGVVLGQATEVLTKLLMKSNSL